MDLVNQLSSICDINPEVWISNLENYIDNVLRKSKKDFKPTALVEVPNEIFQLYCKKVLLDL